MSMVAAEQRIASAFAVFCGLHGAVSRHARERGICRQLVYQEAHGVAATLVGDEWRAERARLQARVRQLEQQLAAARQRLAVAVVLDKDKQAEFATVGQARGVSLPDCRELLEVLIPGQSLSVATLGRQTRAAGIKAGHLLPVLDAWAQQRVREVSADEIYVSAPVLMVVEPASLCWVAGCLSDTVSGAAWAEQFRQLPHLEQVMRDGGTGLAKGVAVVNEERRHEGRPPVGDQGDHFHALRGGSTGLRQAEKQASKAVAEVEEAQKKLAECARQGQKCTGPAARVRAAQQRAEEALTSWCERDQLWQETKEALQLWTPEGELNTRTRAEAVLARTLPQLPESGFAKTKRQVQQPEMLHYLDRVEQQLAALPIAAEVKQAAVRQEGLRQRPELLQGETPAAAARRGVLLVCAVVLGKAGDQGQQAVAAVRDIFRRAYRASSLVECINSVLRMQQARHRKMTQGLLDLKRLYWNCHRFRTGRRRGSTPYQRLGVPWPEGLRWWDVLKWTPEQLRDKLSSTKTAA